VRCGDPDFALSAEPAGRFEPILVDGEPKLLDRSIATLLAQPGLDLADIEWRAA
jgi:hypothetical protein